MSQFFKIIGALVGGLIALLAIGSAGIYGYAYYTENTFSPLEDVNGAYLGMSRRDLLFFLTDVPMMCEDIIVPKTDCELFLYEDPEFTSPGSFYPDGIIRLRNNKVVAISRHAFFRGVIDDLLSGTYFLLKQLGDPDVLVISRDLTSRTYIYVEEALAFNYNEDSLSSFFWGSLSISDIGISSPKVLPEDIYDPALRVQQTYGGASIIVDGEQVCPGETCPFEEGDTFPEFTKMELYGAEEMRKILRGL